MNGGDHACGAGGLRFFLGATQVTFSKHLLLELIALISGYLSTTDFLRLRQDSRAASVVLHCQSFWKTRFAVDGERGFLSNLSVDSSRGRKTLDWRIMYKQSSRRRLDKSEPYKLKRIIWQRCEWLRYRYMATRAKDFGRLSDKVKELADTLSWTRIETESSWPEFGDFAQTLLIEESVCRIEMSMFEEHSGSYKCNRATFIAGLEFICKVRDQPNKIFCYRIPGKQVYTDLESWKDFRAAEVSTSLGGVLAIRICHVQTSEWEGSHQTGQQYTKLERLVLPRTISGIREYSSVSRAHYRTIAWFLVIHFYQNYRMVELAISDTKVGDIADAPKAVAPTDMRALAEEIWTDKFGQSPNGYKPWASLSK